MYRFSSRAFTLIELLVVIAIIAILAIVVVLTLNPAELLRQSRDANRLSDLATLNSAINLYNTDQSGASSYSLGLSSTTYVSLPDSSSTCGDLGGNFTAGGYFTCASTANYRTASSSGWIPVNFMNISAGSPISDLPVDPTNSTSSNLYYSYQTNGSTFRLVATPESQKYLASAGTNPTMFIQGSNTTLDGGNWVPVPGNSTFGTNDFYVMKYDAACVNIGTGVAQTSPTDGNGYKDNNSGASNCKLANGLAPAALPNAIPIVDVSQTSAASYCASIGAHLITNNEWQTIAWNAEGVASNWSGGSVGSGNMARGNSDSYPAAALTASSDDTQVNYGETGDVDFTHRRIQTLSDGSVIWDMAGNIYQWTNDTITGTNEPNGGTPGWNWIQFNTVTTWGSMNQSTAGASNATWNSAQGVGELYAEDAIDGSIVGFLRGGKWTSGALGGIETLGLGNAPVSQNNFIGFRCAR